MTSPHLKKLTRCARYKEAHKAAGLCIDCDEKATEGVYCTEHAAKNRARVRRNAVRRVKEGLCLHCGRPVEKGNRCHNRNECVPSRRMAQ